MESQLDPLPYISEVRLFSGTFAPAGWEFCNGQLLTISQYTPLFTLLGTQFGGNGTTNFALPDLRRRFPRGVHISESNVGGTGGTETVTLTSNEIPSHTHSLNIYSGAGTSNNPSGKTFASNSEGIVQYASSPSVLLNSGSIISSGSGGAHNNMPPYLGLNSIICLDDGAFPSEGGSPSMDGRYLSEIMLIGTNFAPSGWLACEGQMLSISEYDALFTLIGTTFGGNGVTTFALPDLRNRIPVSAKVSEYILGQVGGVDEVTLTTSLLPTHSHGVAVQTGLATTTSPTGNVPASNLEGVRHYASGTDAIMAASTIGVSGNGQSHNNLPPYCNMTYCIAIDGIYPSEA